MHKYENIRPSFFHLYVYMKMAQMEMAKYKIKIHTMTTCSVLKKYCYGNHKRLTPYTHLIIIFSSYKKTYSPFNRLCIFLCGGVYTERSHDHLHSEYAYKNM